MEDGDDFHARVFSTLNPPSSILVFKKRRRFSSSSDNKQPV